VIAENASRRVLTGRAVRVPKHLADRCQRVDTRDLRAHLRSERPCSAVVFTRDWRSRVAVLILGPQEGLPRALAVLDVAAHPTDPDALSAELNARIADAQLVGLTPTHPFYGGIRWWCVCPRCGRRVRTLYRPPGGGQVGCRTCARVTYRSTQQHRVFGWEQLERPWRHSHRQAADWGSRSPRRRLRALLRSPLGPDLRERMRLAGIGLDSRGRPR